MHPDFFPFCFSRVVPSPPEIKSPAMAAEKSIGMVISGSLPCCVAEDILFPEFGLICSTDLGLLHTTPLSSDFSPPENKAASQCREYVFCQRNMPLIVKGCKLQEVRGKAIQSRKDYEVLRGETSRAPEYSEALGPIPKLENTYQMSRKMFLRRIRTIFFSYKATNLIHLLFH